ncbi:ATP-binding protein [Mycetocola tolaasinivorans]|uniref:ATP-binding protein n=1 Tax=Mycetocola tolaasinivorans TaxID=76635 RepID=A0A3L6ZV69_9MICO|nr:ATP-binding protein [Mycetocola tolaasinivorans]RLP71883.1 ATP-binding protein [Mycetocola tolaasinivorans]
MSQQRSAEPSPFSPGYGRAPLVFGGHAEELAELTAVFETLDFGENQTVLLSGLRGSGKTSMLAKIQDHARDSGWLVISDDASAGLMERVMETTIPGLMSEVSVDARRRLTGLGIWKFSAQWEYIDRHREIKPLLRRDLVALSEELSHSGSPAGILITIDEVSSGKTRLRELARFALELSHAIGEGANLMVVFAGIRVNLEALVNEEHTTFLRRSRDLDFRRLTPAETRFVLEESIRIGGKAIDEDALTSLVSVSQGYPYLVQLAGDYAWRNSESKSSITLSDAQAAHGKAIAAVERRVISRVYQDLSEVDQQFIAAMAVDDGPSRVSDIVRRLEVSDQYVQVYKKRLIESGYVQTDGRGLVTFSLPYLRDYVRSLTADDLGTGATDDWDHFPPLSPQAG